MSISDRLLISALFSSSISVICISAKSHIGATLMRMAANLMGQMEPYDLDKGEEWVSYV